MRRTGSMLTVLVALLTGLSACGSGGVGLGGTGAEPRGESVALPGVDRQCYRVNDANDLPEMSDLARLGTRGNVALWGRDMGPADSAVLSVRYDDDGTLVWVRTLNGTLPPHRHASLEQVLMESLDPSGYPDWGVRLRVVGGDIVGLEPSVTCPPEVRRSARLPTVVPSTRRDLYILNQARGRQYPVIISLNERGRITDVQLPRPTGSEVVDQFLLEWVHGTRFHPKLHDGVPIPTTFERTLFIPRRSSMRNRSLMGAP